MTKFMKKITLITILNFILHKVIYCQDIPWIENVEQGDTFAGNVFGLVYPDRPPHSDLFFDRVYGIMLDKNNYLEDGKPYYIVSTGVLIDNNRLITSHNPFRKLINDSYLEYVKVRILSGRFNYNNSQVDYYGQNMNVMCGRPLQPMHTGDVSVEDLWHGKNEYINSPLHDLFLLRVDTNLTVNSNSSDKFLNRHFDSALSNETQVFNATVTLIAKPGERIDRGSLGVAGVELLNLYQSVNESFNVPYRFLEFIHYGIKDVVIEECDEWMPRTWGHFICLKYDSRISKFPSGSLLFSRNKLFGVGSFTLQKHRAGIMVFTDVRPYAELLLMTCTDYELNSKPPS